MYRLAYACTHAYAYWSSEREIGIGIFGVQGSLAIRGDTKTGYVLFCITAGNIKGTKICSIGNGVISISVPIRECKSGKGALLVNTHGLGGNIA